MNLRLFALGFCLIAATLVAWRVLTPPAPLPASAPGSAFSAMRALPDLEIIAARPHPAGSPENQAVRDYLAGRLQQLGLPTLIQHAEHSTGADSAGVRAITPLENVVGVLPGLDRSAPAIALVAHYDSVPGSPGAADDAIGVVSILEIVRALNAKGTPARDVVIVFTDGEELGLLGAKAFAANHPFSTQIGFVINLEAAGSSGRAFMFETGNGNGQTIDLFARTARRPVANSLSVLVYEATNFGTDFTAFKDRIQGLNFAIEGRAFDYHSPTATPANLDRRSLQDMGDQALAATLAVAYGAAPKAAPDVAYADVLGLGVVAYPFAAGWLVLGAAFILLMIGLVRARRAKAFEIIDVARGLAASVLGLAVPAGVLYGFDQLLHQGHAARLARAPLVETCAIILAIGAIAAIGALASIRRPSSIAGVWTGLLLTGLGACIAAQILAPEAGPITAWPLVIACAAAAISGLGTRRGPWIAAALAVLAAFGITLMASLIHIAFFILPPTFAAGWVWIVSWLVWPLIQPWPGERRVWVLPAILLGLGLAGCIWLRTTDPWSPRFPKPVRAAYAASLTAAWRA